jgi:hypothetical protein
MAAAPAVATKPRLAPLDLLRTRLDAAVLSLAQQLASNPHRVRTALRMALIAALGAGLMAAMHIDDSLGIYVLWSIVSAPAAMMVPAKGIGLIVASAISLAISIPLAGSLVETPWLLVPFFAMVAGGWSYHFTDAQLTNGWRMIEVVFLTTFFIIVFDPKNFGWSVAYTFGGMCVTFGLVMLFDNVLWPDPADIRLLQLLTDSTHATRKRLATVGDAYLDPADATRLPPPSVTGALSVHLSLLARADLENLSPRRHALLLGGVSVNERRRLEVERLIAVAREPVPRSIRAWVRPELQAALDAIDACLAAEADHFTSDFYRADQPDTVTPVETALAALNQRIAEQHPRFIASVRADELSNMSAFIVGLQRLARLFRHPPVVLRDASRKPAAREVVLARRDPVKVRYCIKLTLAMALAFVVAMTAHRADLKTIILTVMITGLPTYGASLHKMMLRFAGAALGGALALGAIVVTSPNFETIVSYLVVCFIIFYIAAYLGLSAGGLGYAGKQAGTTFVLVFIALSPSDKIYEPLYRLWGIFLGIIVVALVFLVIAPEYAGESMVPRLEKMLEAILSLMPGGARRLSEREIESIQIDSGKTLSQLLEIADDARIEGRRSIVDPDAIIETVGTLRRITNRLSSAAAALNLVEIPSLTRGFDIARARFNASLAEHFRDCLDFVKRRARGVDRPIPDWDEAAAHALLETLEREVAADNFAAMSPLPIETRRTLLAEMENSRRVTVLAGELAEQLSRIRPGQRPSAVEYANRAS